jgi:hypothetical protein
LLMRPFSRIKRSDMSSTGELVSVCAVGRSMGAGIAGASRGGAGGVAGDDDSEFGAGGGAGASGGGSAGVVD